MDRLASGHLETVFLWMLAGVPKMTYDVSIVVSSPIFSAFPSF